MTEPDSTDSSSVHPRCRPGDIAIIVAAKHKRNLGLIVRVVEADRGEDFIVWPTGAGPVWTCECAMAMKWKKGKKIYRRRRGPAARFRIGR